MTRPILTETVSFYFHLLPPANEVWGKVIFSVARVKNSVGGGSNGGSTPLGRYTPPGRYTPLGRYTPQAGTPPRQVTPHSGTPPRQVHPRDRCPPPPEQCMLGDTSNKRTVRILLECILVLSIILPFTAISHQPEGCCSIAIFHRTKKWIAFTLILLVLCVWTTTIFLQLRTWLNSVGRQSNHSWKLSSNMGGLFQFGVNWLNLHWYWGISESVLKGFYILSVPISVPSHLRCGYTGRDRDLGRDWFLYQ